MCTESARSIHGVCTEGALRVQGVFTESARSIHGVCTEGALSIPNFLHRIFLLYNFAKIFLAEKF